VLAVVQHWMNEHHRFFTICGGIRKPFEKNFHCRFRSYEWVNMLKTCVQNVAASLYKFFIYSATLLRPWHKQVTNFMHGNFSLLAYLLPTGIICEPRSVTKSLTRCLLASKCCPGQSEV